MKILTYKEFSKLVPEETLNFVNYLLEEKLSHEMYAAWNETLSCDATRYYLSVLDAFYNYNEKNKIYLKEFNDFISNMGSFRYHSSRSSKFKSEIFSNNGQIFCICDNLIDYKLLSPKKILLNSIIEYKSTNVDRYVFVNFKSYDNIGNVCRKLRSDISIEEADNLNDLLSNLSKDKETNTFFNMVKAAKILEYLDKEKYNIKNISTDDESLKQVSMLIALLWTCNNERDMKKDEYRLKKYFEEKDIQLSKILTYIGINETNITNLLQSYNKDKRYALFLNTYFNNQLNKNLSSVNDYIDEIFNKNYSIQQIMNNFKINDSDIEEIKNKIIEEKGQAERLIEEQKKIDKEQELVKFYKSLRIETKKYIEFTSKIYSIILKKYNDKNPKNSNEYIKYIDDVDTLSLLISDYYNNGPVSEFFINNGVTLEKILKMLDLNINKDTIDKVDSSDIEIPKIFQKFINDGVNASKNVSIVTPLDISLNLCDRNFNKSTILEEIFYKLTNGKNLNSNFQNQLNEDKKLREKQRIRNLKENICKDLDYNTLQFIINVSNISKDLSSCSTDNLKYNKNLEFFSILYATLTSSNCDDELKEYIKSIGITTNNIGSTLSLTLSSRNNNYDTIKIDEINNKYLDIIFKGLNEKKERSQIRPRDIVSNVLNNKEYYSPYIEMYLGKNNIDRNKFKNLDEKIAKKQEQDIIDEMNENYNSIIKNLDSESLDYIIKVSNIYVNLENFFKENKNDLIKDEKDIEELSMLLGLYAKNDSDIKFFVNEGLSINQITKKLNLNPELINNISNEINNKEILINHFKKYVTNYYTSMRIIKENIVNDNINNSLLIENLIASFKKSYEIISKELKTGEEYHLPITIDNGVELLQNLEVPEIDCLSTLSIFSFGNELDNHNKYLQEEVNNVKENTSLDVINEFSSLSNKIYGKKPEKKGFLAALDRFMTLDPIEPQNEIKDASIEEIKEKSKQLKLELTNEVNVYLRIFEYLKVYREKNKEYLIQIKKAIIELNEYKSKLNENDPEEDILKINTNLAILHNKAIRLAQSDQIMSSYEKRIMIQIQNDSMVMESLQASENIMPFIGTELALKAGSSTGKRGMELSKEIMYAYQKLLESNKGVIIDSINMLDDNLSENEILELLENKSKENMNNYIAKCNEALNMNTTKDSLEVNDETDDKDRQYLLKMNL